jgi:transketolase
VPEGVSEAFHDAIAGRGQPLREGWEDAFARYKEAYPAEAEEFELMRQGKLPTGWEEALPTFEADAKRIASRDAGGKVINAIASKVPMLIGGAADLSPSTKTDIKEGGSFEAGNYGGRNLHFGVREHAMGSIANGMALSYLRSYTGTFLVFADAAADPACRDHGGADRFRVHARQHRRGRGRADPPAHRASRDIAGNPRA